MKEHERPKTSWIYQDISSISISEPYIYIYMNSMNNSITSPQYQLPSQQPWSVETIHWVP